MKAILVDEKENLVWSEVNDPTVASDEVLVKIEAAALNRADLLQRQGKYPSPKGCPEWMGLEIAGEIIKMGCEAQTSSNWKKGDKVCALLGGGGYAQYVSVKYDMLMPVPKGLTVIEAAALPEAYATSYLNLSKALFASGTAALFEDLFDIISFLLVANIILPAAS
jgi:NADPH2:quinone reductase